MRNQLGIFEVSSRILFGSSRFPGTIGTIGILGTEQVIQLDVVAVVALRLRASTALDPRSPVVRAFGTVFAVVGRRLRLVPVVVVVVLAQFVQETRDR